MLKFVNNFFKISSLNNEARKFILRTSFTQYIFVFLISFSNMFVFLQALLTLDVATVAILVSIYLLTESIFAIPAGTLGDSKSFRIVLSISVLFYFFTYRMVIIAHNFNEFLIVYILLGMSSAFNLDGFFSFFDNNYDYYVYEDTNRSIYSEFVGKFVAIKTLILALGYSVGAYFAATYSRVELFNYSSYLLLLVLLLTFIFYKDHKNFKLKKKLRAETVFSMLPKSIAFSWRKRTLRFFIIGIVIAELTTVLWNELYSILLYSQIGANNDSYIGFIFSSEVLITAILIGLLGILAGKVMRIKFWYLFSLLLAYTTFYFGLSYFLEKNPPPQTFNVNYLAIFLGLYFVIMIPYNFNYVLYYRTILDLMPEKYRGSIYSIISSLKSIIGSIILFIGGKYLIQKNLSIPFYYIGIIGLVGSIIIFLSIIRYNLKTTIKEPIGFLTAFLVNTRSGFENFYLIQNEGSIDSHKADINNIVKELSAIAMADLQITSEEKEMIDVIITDIQAYFAMLDDFESDKSTKKKEKKELLSKQKENILSHAYANLSKAQSNEDLTKLLSKLNEIVAHL